MMSNRTANAAGRIHLSALLLLLASFLLAGAGPEPVLAAAAASAAVLLLCRTLLGAVAVPSVPTGRIRTALRDRSRRTAFLQQRDPDAAGRPRPRAPGRCSTTAA